VGLTSQTSLAGDYVHQNKVGAPERCQQESYLAILRFATHSPCAGKPSG